MIFLTVCLTNTCWSEDLYLYYSMPVLDISGEANGTSFKYQSDIVTTIEEFTYGPPDSPIIHSTSVIDYGKNPQTIFLPLSGADLTYSVKSNPSAYGREYGPRIGPVVTEPNFGYLAYDPADATHPWYETRNFIRPPLTAHQTADQAQISFAYFFNLGKPDGYWNSQLLNVSQLQHDPTSVMILRWERAIVRHSWFNYNPPWSTSGFWRDQQAENGIVPCDSWPLKPFGSPGWANGFDFDPDANVSGDNSTIHDGVAISDGHLIQIYIPGKRFELQIDYKASDPADIQQNGVTDIGKPKFKLPDTGNVRLWNLGVDGYGGVRSRNKKSVTNGGNYVPPGMYTEKDTFFNEDGTRAGRWVTFHIEGVKRGPATFKIDVKSHWTDERGTEQTVATKDEETIQISPPNNPGPCNCGVEGQYEDSSSVIDNNTLTYRHEADDFAYPQAGSSCGSCGGSALGASGGTSRPSLRLHRIHRYDLQDWPSSMGPGVFLSYDVRLRELKPSGAWQLWDPSHHQIVSLSLLGDNRLHDQGQGSLRDVTFYNASGAPIPPTGADVIRAILTEFDGQTVEFELIPAPSTDAIINRYARPTRFADSRGQAVVISYVYPCDASDATLGNERAKLWQFTSITDSYGLAAIAAYGAAVAGQYPLASLTVGGGTPIVYDYVTSGPLIGLSAVHQRDNSLTTITAAPSVTPGVLDLTFNDSMADGMHQQKIVTFTAPVFGGSSPWRVQQVRKDNGETIYRALATGDDDGNNVTLVQDGERIYRYVTNGGIPVRTDYLKSGTFDTAMSSGIWETAHTFALDSMNRVIGSADGLGQSTTTERDPVTGYPTKITYADTTFETFTYDAVGNRLTHRDRLQRQTDWHYDSFRNRTYEMHADGGIRTWSYDPTTGQLLTETDERSNVTIYHYTPNGLLDRVEEPADQAGGTRSAVTFGYDAFHRLAWSKDQLDRQVQYFYDSRNRLWKTLYADTSTELITYGSGANAGRVVQKIDRNGEVTDFIYDSVGRRIATTQYAAHAGGVLEPIVDAAVYVPGSELVAMRSARGEIMVYGYDERRRQVSQTVYATKIQALTTTTAYDAAGHRLSETDPYGRKTYYVYDSNDRQLRMLRETSPGIIPANINLTTLARDPTVNPLWVIEETTYDTEGQVATRIDGRSIVTEYGYDSVGRMARQTDAKGTADETTTRFFYDLAGNQIRIEHPRHVTETAGVNANGFVSTRTYTARSLLETSTEAFARLESATTMYVYDLDRKQSVVTDARGQSTQYRYGICCARLKEIQDPLGFISKMNYDFVGRTTSTTDPNSLATLTTYDALSRPLTRMNAKGETSSYAYDDNLTDGVGLDAQYATAVAGLGFGFDPVTGYGADGAAVEMKDPIGNKTLTITDGVGRTVRSVDALGHITSMSYDQLVADTHLNSDATITAITLVKTTATDALGHTSQQWSDGLGRAQVQVDALGNKVHMGFDANGNQLRIRDANNVGQDCMYDFRNRPTTCTETALAAGSSSSGLRSSGTQYDAAGNVISRLDGHQVPETFTYDSRNRKITQRDRNQALTQFQYDAMNNLTKIIDAENGITQYQYDERNLLTTEIFPGPTGGTKRYTYDPGRRLKTRTEAVTAGGP